MGYVRAVGAVKSLLASLSVVEQFSIVEVSGDRIQLRVDAIGGEERLRRALQFNGLIEREGPVDERSVLDDFGRRLEFFYSP